MIFSTLTRDQKAELKDGLRQIAEHYGIEHQQAKLIEECGEYITAVMKTNEAGLLNRSVIEIEDRLDDQLSEFADIGVVWLQLFYLMHPDRRQAVLGEMLFKIRRQITRIEQEEQS
jgi:NTP pyrophosphatase (non-canonical NTP hydrolase)